MKFEGLILIGCLPAANIDNRTPQLANAVQGLNLLFQSLIKHPFHRANILYRRRIEHDPHGSAKRLGW